MWFILSVASAFFDSIKDVFGKKSAVHLDEYVAAWSQRVFALVVVVPLMLLHIPAQLDREFWQALAIIVILATMASILYMKALKHAPLSVVVPIASLTPVFILATAPFINHEQPKLFGIVGVCITVVGAYVLQLSKRRDGFWKPFTSLVADRGSRYMFGVVILWSITSPYDKVAIQHSNPYFYVGIANLCYMLTLLPFVLTNGRLRSVFKHARTLAPIGFGQGFAVLFQMLAVPLTFVSYTTAVKRSSSIFSVAWGKWLFKEEKTPERLAGALIILAGIILMLVS